MMGTRGEAIKLAPVVQELEKHRESVETIVVVTAQHRELLAQAMEAFGVKPHVDLGLLASRTALADYTARAINAFTSCLSEVRPDIVLVQGENATVLALCLAAHFQGIPVAHLDAGLRSGQVRLPSSEQLNQRIAAVVSDLHFTTTAVARDNLLREGVPGAHIVVAGNTLVDAMRMTPRRQFFDNPRLNVIPWSKRRIVVVTVHRMENLGDALSQVCQSLIELTALHSDLHVILPVHLNPRVRRTVVDELSGIPRIDLLEPLGYGDMMEALRRAEFAITDSGGLQEECASISKPVLILRRSTDRHEVISCGAGRLVGTSSQRIVESATRLLDDSRELMRMCECENPYGYGLAAPEVVRTLLSRTPRNAGGLLVAEGPAPLPPRYAVEP